jgi:hypothetical protein
MRRVHLLVLALVLALVAELRAQSGLGDLAWKAPAGLTALVAAGAGAALAESGALGRMWKLLLFGVIALTRQAEARARGGVWEAAPIGRGGGRRLT